MVSLYDIESPQAIVVTDPHTRRVVRHNTGPLQAKNLYRIARAPRVHMLVERTSWQVDECSNICFEGKKPRLHSGCWRLILRREAPTAALVKA